MRRAARPAALICLAWLLALLFHTLGVDWLSLLGLWLGTAGLLRLGESLIDRLVGALGLMIGSACAAGLLFTVWPWGIEPLAVAGLGFTLLILAGGITGRGFSLPRPRWTDGLAAAGALVVAWVVARPVLRGDAVDRLAIIMRGEDNSRHISILDAIRETGGYLFVTGEHHAVVTPRVTYYPQGWHLNVDLLDVFLRSSTGRPEAQSMIDHYLGYLVGWYGLLALAVMWAAVRLGRRGWLAVPVVGVIALVLVRGDLIITLLNGYPAEVFGLVLLALLVGVLCGPSPSPRDQLVVAAALLVGIGFGYYLFLPAAGLAALCWLFVERRKLAEHRRFTWVAVGSAAVLAPIAAIVGSINDTQAGVALIEGNALISRAGLLLLSLTVLAGVLATWAEPAWRRYRWVAAAVVGFAAAYEIVQRSVTGGAGYYEQKVLHSVLVVLLIGLGSAAVFGRARRQQLLLSVAALAGLAAVGINVVRSEWGTSWQEGQTAGYHHDSAAELLRAHQLYPVVPGTITVIVSGDPVTSYSKSLLFTALQRTSGEASDFVYRTDGLLGSGTDAGMEHMLTSTDTPIRVLSDDPAASERVAKIIAAHPDRRIELVRL